MRVYTTTMTALVASIIAFDILWCFTAMDAIEIFFLALCFGFVVAAAFLFLTDFIMEPKKSKRNRPIYITDDDTGLQYMPMRKGRVM